MEATSCPIRHRTPSAKAVLALSLFVALMGALSVSLFPAAPESKPTDDQGATNGAGQVRDQEAVKPVPHVTLTVRIIDGEGKPAPAWPYYDIKGRLDGHEWSSQIRPDADRFGVMIGRVPLGLVDLDVSCVGDNVWWTWGPGSPRINYAHIQLNRVARDRPEIVVQRMKSAALELRLRSTTGELPDDPQVGVFYPLGGGADGGRLPERVAPGVYRLDEQLLAGRATEVEVRAPGFKTLMTQPFEFTAEGQKGVVELTLEPGESTDGGRLDSLVPVILKTADGRPIVKPAAPEGPDLIVDCLATDWRSGRAVDGAVVEYELEEWRGTFENAEGETLESQSTRTGEVGEFTIPVPWKYLRAAGRERQMVVRVTVRHPRYVTKTETQDLGELARTGLSPDFPFFRFMSLRPTREISGQLVDRQGRPIPGVKVTTPFVSDEEARAASDVSNADGRFRARVPAGEAVQLHFRAFNVARSGTEVAAERSDAGVIHLLRGERITGRVVDGDGKPLPGISLTASSEDAGTQPNPAYEADGDGRFRTDELVPGKYRVEVGDLLDDEGDPAKGPPGLYTPTLVEIRDGAAAPDVTLRPIDSVRCVARLVSSRTRPVEDQDLTKLRLVEEALLPLFYQVPVLNIRGRYRGAMWDSSFPLTALDEEEHRCVLLAPKGLADTTLVFGQFVQHFRLDAKSPKLFGTGFRVGTLDADRGDIVLYRYRETTLNVHLEPTGGAKLPGDLKVESHYVREPEMRAAGAVFEVPLPEVQEKDGRFRVAMLPDEQVEVTAGPTSVRVKLAEGETRDVVLKLPAAR